MRTKLALSLLIVSGATSAQNWALLNPAYKYNYSNDGSDTISNQIFITHIDTLGLDSFRYELNRIGVVCDTCSYALAYPVTDTCDLAPGSCNGCFVWIDHPQFLGGSCTTTNGVWFFYGPDSIVLMPEASVGSIWTYDEGLGVTAVVDEKWLETVFGLADSLKRILLSSGDTIVVSKSFGVLDWRQADDRYELIGVHGIEVGRLLPRPLDFFDFQTNDELTYRLGELHWAGGPEWFYPNTHSRLFRVVITGRTDGLNEVVYSTSISSTALSGQPGELLDAPDWELPSNHWVFDPASLLLEHPMAGAYPGQVLRSSIVDPAPYGAWYIAKHGLTADGRTIMEDAALPDGSADDPGIFPSCPVLPGLHMFHDGMILGVRYEERLGVVSVRKRYPFGSVYVNLVGAILAGDTLIAPPANPNWITGSEAPSETRSTIGPNPASAYVDIRGLPIGETLTIHDMSGKLRLDLRVVGETTSIRVTDWQDGVYVVRILGRAPMLMTVVH